MLCGITASDGVRFEGAVGALAVAVTCASYIPARRAAARWSPSPCCGSTSPSAPRASANRRGPPSAAVRDGERPTPRRRIRIRRDVSDRTLKRDARAGAIEVRRLRADRRVHDRGARRDVVVAERVSELVNPEQPPARIIPIEIPIEPHRPADDGAVGLLRPVAVANRIRERGDTGLHASAQDRTGPTGARSDPRRRTGGARRE